MPNFVTPYNYSINTGFRNLRSSKTEKYGYIPARKQIENLMLAGKRLDAYRSGLYLYNAGSFENLSMADEEALKVPFYNDSLSLAEKASYMAGLRRAFAEQQANVARSEELKKADKERLERLTEAFERSVGISRESVPVVEKTAEASGTEAKA